MNKMKKITPVILSGGSGTRLWPVSRKSYPKQFVQLVGDSTLFQETAIRMTGEQFERPLIVTSTDFRFIVAEQLNQVGIEPHAILIEPESRNTAPAILAAAVFLINEDPDAIMLVAPSDHIISDTKAFQESVFKGLPATEECQLVTFGIKPDRAETAYGYLELGPSNSSDIISLKRFVEKPNSELAQAMVNSGNFLWNSGIFLFKASDIIQAFRDVSDYNVDPIIEALKNSEIDLDFCRLDADAWAKAQDASIDYAVMEKTQTLAVVPFEAGWSDLGSWDAVWREGIKDKNGVLTSNGATAIDCKNSLLRSDSSRLEVVGIGLENIIAVAMHDAVLVASMSRSQDVKNAVAALKSKNIEQAVSLPKDHRPWGWFESLVQGTRFQVKRIHVHPGAALSLQSHHHRSEHWIVVEGTARVTVGEETRLITENESVYIPLGAIHRLENPGQVPMVLIEVQTGAYLGEDDIIRLNDIYARQ